MTFFSLFLSIFRTYLFDICLFNFQRFLYSRLGVQNNAVAWHLLGAFTQSYISSNDSRQDIACSFPMELPFHTHQQTSSYLYFISPESCLHIVAKVFYIAEDSQKESRTQECVRVTLSPCSEDCRNISISLHLVLYIHLFEMHHQ